MSFDSNENHHNCNPHVCVYVCMYIYMYMMHICIYIYMYMYVCTRTYGASFGNNSIVTTSMVPCSKYGYRGRYFKHVGPPFTMFRFVLRQMGVAKTQGLQTRPKHTMILIVESCRDPILGPHMLMETLLWLSKYYKPHFRSPHIRRIVVYGAFFGGPQICLKVQGTHKWLHNCSYNPLIRPLSRVNIGLYVEWEPTYKYPGPHI